MIDTLKFEIHPSSTRGLGDGVADGDNPIKAILQAQAKFVLQFQYPPSVVVLHPKDTEDMQNNAALAKYFGPHLLNGDGNKFVALPSIKLCESLDTDVGIAIMEGQLWPPLEDHPKKEQ